MKFLKKRLDMKVGRPPGDLNFIGEEERWHTNINLYIYDDKEFKSFEVRSISDLHNITSDKINWIDIEGFEDIGLIKSIGKYFEVDEMVIEDILNSEHPPKYEEGMDYIYFILKSFTDFKTEFIANQVTVMLKNNIVLSFQEKRSHLLPPKIERIKNANGRARRKKADYLFFVLLDAFIDSYYIYFEKIREEIVKLDNIIINDTTKNHINKIYELKNKLTSTRKYLFPLKTAIAEFFSFEPTSIEHDNYKFFNDCKDHINELLEYYHYFGELTNNLISLNENNLNNNTNRIMKVLTIIATIFIPLTFIAGIYGMNFKFMPELEWNYGYYFALSIMVLIGILILLIMKRKKWI